MYGLPDGTDLSFLNGRQLHQACFASNVVILNFDENTSVSIEAVFHHVAADGKRTRCEDPQDSALVLLGLLGRSICLVTWETNGDLCMEFSGGESLQLQDDSDAYEAYQIRHGEKLIVV